VLPLLNVTVTASIRTQGARPAIDAAIADIADLLIAYPEPFCELASCCHVPTHLSGHYISFAVTSAMMILTIAFVAYQAKRHQQHENPSKCKDNSHQKHIAYNITQPKHWFLPATQKRVYTNERSITALLREHQSSCSRATTSNLPAEFVFILSCHVSKITHLDLRGG
jgi:hypothetical protein